MPFGQVPVLDVDGQQLSQSLTILRYIAKKHGLEAEEEWARAVGDELATTWMDMYARLASYWFHNDQDLKKEIFGQMAEEFAKPRVKIFNHRFSRNIGEFVCGDKVTWCDFAIYNTLTMVEEILKIPLSDYPHLDAYVKRIEALPNIQEWRNNHPNTPFAAVPSPLD